MYKPNRTSAILPTGSRLSPKNPAANEFHASWPTERTGTYLLLRQYYDARAALKVRYIILSGSGDPTGYPAVGATIDAHHDQTLRQLGPWTVIQAVRHADAVKLERSAPLYVYK